MSGAACGGGGGGSAEGGGSLGKRTRVEPESLEPRAPGAAEDGAQDGGSGAASAGGNEDHQSKMPRSGEQEHSMEPSEQPSPRAVFHGGVSREASVEPRVVTNTASPSPSPPPANHELVAMLDNHSTGPEPLLDNQPLVDTHHGLNTLVNIANTITNTLLWDIDVHHCLNTLVNNANTITNTLLWDIDVHQYHVHDVDYVSSDAASQASTDHELW